MKTLVLSHTISKNTPLYGGREKMRIREEKAIHRGDSSNKLRLDISNHTGTHVDLPRHFLARGKTLTDIASEDWLFENIRIKKVTVHPGEELDEKIFNGLRVDRRVEFLILKTGFEKKRGKKDYVKRSPIIKRGLAKFLKAKFPRLRAIGFDLISLSSLLDRQEGRAAHKEFLKRDILIVEDMKLQELESTPDSLLLSPLLIEKGDGAPVTAWAFFDSVSFDQFDAFLFDFDGVILDSFDVKTKAFYKLYEPYGKRVAKKVTEHHVKHGGVSRFEKFRYCHREFLSIDLKEKEVRALTKKFSSLVFDEVLRSPYIPGVQEFLRKCKAAKKKCFVVTGTPDWEIKPIVKRLKLQPFFKEVIGSPPEKTTIIKQVIQKYKIDPKKAVYFGDARTDLEAATDNRMKFVGINCKIGNQFYKDFRKMMKN